MCIMSIIRDALKVDDVEWIAVCVWGFEDSPVSWSGCEHGSFTWGDNHYTTPLFRGDRHWTLTSLGTHDVIH